MPFHSWHAVVLVLCVLSGCNANYVFDDADYRPLGDPQAVRRGQ
ncbi:type VI secretion protein [Pseudomonas sp. MPB26]